MIDELTDTQRREPGDLVSAAVPLNSMCPPWTLGPLGPLPGPSGLQVDLLLHAPLLWTTRTFNPPLQSWSLSVPLRYLTSSTYVLVLLWFTFIPPAAPAPPLSHSRTHCSLTIESVGQPLVQLIRRPRRKTSKHTPLPVYSSQLASHGSWRTRREPSRHREKMSSSTQEGS